MFILVHAGDDGREYALNLDNVTAVGRTINGATFINFDHNNFIRVQESYDDILVLMQTVINNGRFRGVDDVRH